MALAHQHGGAQEYRCTFLLGFLETDVLRGLEGTFRVNWPADLHPPGGRPHPLSQGLRSMDLGSLFRFKTFLPAFWLKTELRKKKILKQGR